MTKPLQRCATDGMVPFENVKGVAVTAKGLIARIRILCKNYVPFVNVF